MARFLLVIIMLSVISVPRQAWSQRLLPHDSPWKITLRDWLSTLRSDDFLLPDRTLTFPEDYDRRSNDQIYRDWIVLGHPGREPVRAGFEARAEWFTLSRIEGDEIRCFPEPAALAWWIGFEFPGNALAGSAPGQRRALVIAIVDMLMLETSHADPRNLKPDFIAANLGTWSYTLRVCRSQLNAEVQRAYRQGLLYYLSMMERIAPRDGNSNMDMREIVTLVELDHVFHGEPAIHRRLVALARRILFGRADRGPATSDPRRGTFHPAGYIGEADGPETSYNGISLYHLAEAALVSRGDPDWDAFLPEVVRRMVKLRAYNAFPEPDGRLEGPSSWSTRTNDPYVHDQRDRPWRAFAEAMLTREALYRLNINKYGNRDRPFQMADRAQMLADIRRGVQRLNRRPRRPERWQADQPPEWQERHWPADLPYTWDHYVTGSYSRFLDLHAARSSWLLPPFSRSADFNLSFDDEFWIGKKSDWGFQVEAIPHLSRSYDKGGSGALAGGSLAAFWTAATGVTVLGRLPDKWNNVTWDKIEQWPTHHVWGRTSSGPAFSSARQWHPWVHFQIDQPLPQVHVLGSLGPRRTVQKEDLLDPGHVYYRREFTMRSRGLHVRSELLSGGVDNVSELWDSLPVFLEEDRRARRGNRPTADTNIEFFVAGDWKPGTTTLTPAVRAVRIHRFGGAVVIEFDSPRRVALSDIITTRYQKRDRLRNLKIDLMDPGLNQSMPRKTSVGYLIRPH